VVLATSLPRLENVCPSDFLRYVLGCQPGNFFKNVQFFPFIEKNRIFLAYFSKKETATNNYPINFIEASFKCSHINMRPASTGVAPYSIK